MDNINLLTAKLSELIALEGTKTREEITGYIVGELLGNPEGKYDGLEDDHPNIKRIGDLASDLEWSNGSEEELQVMWKELKQLIDDITA